MTSQLWIICGIIAFLVSTTLPNRIYWFSTEQLNNCSCPVNSDYDCDKPFVQLQTDCNCTTIVGTELNSHARAARQNDIVFWSNQNTNTLICCADASSNIQASMLRVLLNFVYIRNLTLNRCHNLMNNGRVTLYGLEKITVETTDTSAYPMQNLSMAGTDLSSSSTEYKDFHVIRMQLGVVTGNKPLRAWSIIRRSNNTSNPLKQRGLNQREDGRFMLTYIYV